MQCVWHADVKPSSVATEAGPVHIRTCVPSQYLLTLALARLSGPNTCNTTDAGASVATRQASPRRVASASRPLHLVDVGGNGNNCAAQAIVAGALAAFGLAAVGETGHVLRRGGPLQQSIDGLAEQLRDLVARCCEDEQIWRVNGFAAALPLVCSADAQDIDAMSDAVVSAGPLLHRHPSTRQPVLASVRDFAQAVAKELRKNGMMGAWELSILTHQLRHVDCMNPPLVHPVEVQALSVNSWRAEALEALQPALAAFAMEPLRVARSACRSSATRRTTKRCCMVASCVPRQGAPASMRQLRAHVAARTGLRAKRTRATLAPAQQQSALGQQPPARQRSAPPPAAGRSSQAGNAGGSVLGCAGRARAALLRSARASGGVERGRASAHEPSRGGSVPPRRVRAHVGAARERRAPAARAHALPARARGRSIEQSRANRRLSVSDSPSTASPRGRASSLPPAGSHRSLASALQEPIVAHRHGRAVGLAATPALGTAVYQLKGAGTNSTLTSKHIESQGFVAVVFLLLLLGRRPLNMLIDGDCDPYLALSTWGMPPAWLPDKFHCLIHICKGVRGWMENLKEKIGCAMLNFSRRDRYIRAATTWCAVLDGPFRMTKTLCAPSPTTLAACLPTAVQPSVCHTQQTTLPHASSNAS